ncbi:MAG: asparagine synthase-related protein [Phenylobacterium sp.]|uniref:asparagine synthase-related protein n=1 Tax=Phenylobacterium sp. TaxID=1871053 RepID=UPI0027356A7F|nr:asparagine synthase-related protein [Phenylobacterium sp.]MDP3747616.1 asparagine synthase-related protein [Phenylobacterium sp.]
MANYIALSWPPEREAAQARVDQLLEDRVMRRDWRPAEQREGFCILVEAARPLPIRRFVDDSARILGDLFERPTGQTAPDILPSGAWRLLGAEARCAHFSAAYWGRYVVVQPDPAGGIAVFRDPSGALDCLTWQADGITIAASSLPDWLLSALPPHLDLNWRAIAAFLADPATLGARLGLDGVAAVLPGTLHGPVAGRAALAIWRPAAFVRATAPCYAEAKTLLARTVDACVAAYAASGAPLLAEVSGGLDSSIVASALARTPDAAVVQWMNFHVADPQGDERRYARALADRLAVPLTEIAKPELALTREALDDQVVGVRPSLNGLDRHYDTDIADRCAALGVRSILTGQGGDMIFFQAPTPLVAADVWRRRAGRREAIEDVARWTRRSVWSVLWAASLASVGVGHRRRRPSPAFMTPQGVALATGVALHPWLEDLRGVSPAKRLQIRGLANAQGFFGDCQRARQAELIHPLLSQPIVELCLAIPAIDLTRGGHGRALAREAFADRLPDLVTQRRSKGDLTAYYGRMLGRSLDVLRPYLLEGRLAQAGLIDRDALGEMLTETHLIWRGGYPDLLRLLAVEIWLRHWARRIGDLASHRH